MSITIRRVTASDKASILEISSKIWGGDDYVPFVFDEWLKDPKGFFACAEYDGKISGFDRCVEVNPGYFWLEGLRADPKLQGHGVGEALTSFFIDLGIERKAHTLALSTYVDNKASIHIIEKNGFEKVAGFIFFETWRRKKITPKSVPGVEKIDSENALGFILDSDFVKLSNGYFPHGWKFINLQFGVKKVLNENSFIFGVKSQGEIVGLACGGEIVRGSGVLSVFFIDGTPKASSKLLKAVLSLKSIYSGIEFMIPAKQGQSFSTLDIIKKAKIRNHNNYAPDVFVYEKKL
ncbi:MAG: GNAT family N-acetyltransferase [Caldisericaceae bacterium]